VKITIGGETFDYEQRRPMSEAIAIEKAWGRRYAEWESELAAGSAEAAAVLAWIILRRDGQDIPLEDILSGKRDFDYRELLQSMIAFAEEAQDPPGGTGTVPDGTGTTLSGTPPSSPRSSGSGRGKSGGSAPPSSTP